MKLTFKNLVAVAALAFTLSFVAGMSATVIYQEHQSLKPFIAAQKAAQEIIPEDVLLADVSVDNFS